VYAVLQLDLDELDAVLGVRQLEDGSWEMLVEPRVTMEQLVLIYAYTHTYTHIHTHVHVDIYDLQIYFTYIYAAGDARRAPCHHGAARTKLVVCEA
jgi:hypothetical protein